MVILAVKCIHMEARVRHSGYPYMTIDNMDSGPELYIATENMTLPNYKGAGKSIYGTYRFMVRYFWDADSDFNTTQEVKWELVTEKTCLYQHYHW